MFTSQKSKLLVVALFPVMLSACASGPPPEAEIQDAQLALEAAVDAGAEQHATDELSIAREQMQQANAKVEKKKYDDAKPLLRQTIMSAKLAQRTAEAQVARSEIGRLSAKNKMMSEETQRLQSALDDTEARLLAQQREVKALQDLQAKQTDRGMVLTLGDVLFETDKSELSGGAMSTMDQIAAFMKRYPERHITIEGHTDDRGDEEYNRELSLERAVSVKTALAQRSVASYRISVVGRGESVPLVNNSNEASRQQNRRVEVIFNQTEQLMSDLDY